MLFYARDDEELVDQKKYLEERCKPQCVKSLYEYDVCASLSFMGAQNSSFFTV